MEQLTMLLPESGPIRAKERGHGPTEIGPVKPEVFLLHFLLLSCILSTDGSLHRTGTVDVEQSISFPRIEIEMQGDWTMSRHDHGAATGCPSPTHPGRNPSRNFWSPGSLGCGQPSSELECIRDCGGEIESTGGRGEEEDTFFPDHALRATDTKMMLIEMMMIEMNQQTEKSKQRGCMTRK